MTNSVTFDPAVGGDGSTVTDGTDSNGLVGDKGYGYTTKLVPCFSNVVSIASFTQTKATAAASSAGSASSSAGNASASATAAAASATSAAATVSGAAQTATSTTSFTLAATSKTFTLVESARAYGVGTYLKCTNDSSHYATGTVTAYSGNSLTVSFDTVLGSGTFTSWTFTIALNLATGVASVDGQTGAVVTRTPQAKSAAYTAVKNDYLYPTAPIAITLPASPTLGDTVTVHVAPNIGVPWVVPNGSPINRCLGSNFYIDVPGRWIFTYFDSTRGWLVSC